MATPTPHKPGCTGQHLLIRIFEEQTVRVSLDGNEIVNEREAPLGPEFTGEVEVECQELDCLYFEGFEDWQDAPESLRGRIKAALDSYYEKEGA